MADKTVRMKKKREFVRTFNAGDWIAAIVVVCLAAWVLWHTAGSLWNLAVFSLQPALPAEVLAAEGGFDLVAQRSMAAAAWWMVIITGVSALVGSAGLLLIALTLREARRSANAADLAVEASREAVAATRETGKAQIRAYVMVSEVKVERHRSGMFDFSVGFLNAGQTPAHRIFVSMNTWFALTHDSEEHVDEIAEQCFDLAPGDDDKVGFVTHHMHERVMALPFARTATIHLEVEIMYDDVFGDSQTTKATFFGHAAAAMWSVTMYRNMED